MRSFLLTRWNHHVLRLPAIGFVRVSFTIYDQWSNSYVMNVEKRERDRQVGIYVSREGTKSEPVNCNLNIYASWRIRIKITPTTLGNDVKKNEKKAGLHVWELLYFRTRALSFYFNEDCENYGHPVFRKWISFFLVLETACINLGNNHAGN